MILRVNLTLLTTNLISLIDQIKESLEFFLLRFPIYSPYRKCTIYSQYLLNDHEISGILSIDRVKKRKNTIFYFTKV